LKAGTKIGKKMILQTIHHNHMLIGALWQQAVLFYRYFWNNAKIARFYV